MSIFDDASSIMNAALHAALPDTAVEQALHSLPAYSGRLILIAVGKAAWQMAAAAHKQLGDRISGGVVITKYDHAQGPIGPLTIWQGILCPTKTPTEPPRPPLRQCRVCVKMTWCFSSCPAADRRCLRSH